MSREQARLLRDQLATSGVRLKPTPRGFDSQRGVPDSVVWIEPTTISISRLFPILVELEGTLSNVDDFEKFASRSSDEEPYQHHIELPSLITLPETVDRSLTYHIAPVGHELVSTASSDGLTEPEFHNAVREWAQGQATSFQTDARITILNHTRIVWWQLSFSMYGHHFETQIPFVIDAGEEFTRKFELYASRIVIPAVAVTTDETRYEKSEVKYATDIQFRRTQPINHTG